MTKQARRYTEVNRLVKQRGYTTAEAIRKVAEADGVSERAARYSFYAERRARRSKKPTTASVSAAVAASAKTPEKTPESLIGDAVDALAEAIGLIRVRLVDIEKREADIKAFDDKIAALLNAAATTN